MQETLKTAITATLQELYGTQGVPFSIEFPGDMAHGDYATNVALVVSKQLGKSPVDVASAIVANLQGKAIEGIADISVAGPGFINFTFTREYIASVLQGVNEQWGMSTQYSGKTILVEHSSPNLFKPFHIGHLMNNTIGESVTRLARASGATVKTMSFPSDISLGVAKAIFILLEKFGPDFVPTDVTVLGDAYVEGIKRYEDDKSVEGRVKEIADNLYAHTPSPEVTLFDACKAFNMQYFEAITARLGSHFDSYIYESEAGVKGKAIVEAHTPDVFTKSEGAIVYIPDESRKDINTAVFINSQGNPTYEAKDVGLLTMKFEQHNPELSLFVTDHEQASHFRVVFDAMSHIHPEWVKRSVHLTHGRMSFKGQKMSSRLGGVPLAEEVLGAVIEEVRAKNPDVSTDAAQQIGLAAIKFVILRTMAGKNINFDPDTSLSFEGDSGPYIQYTTVRARAVIAKAGEQGITPAFTTPHDDSLTLERLLGRYPHIVARSISEWAPHHVVGYLLELAQAFNSWYSNTKIIDPADQAGTQYRLFVTRAVAQTLANGLKLLGIEVPERM